jgi:hypothetical protein
LASSPTAIIVKPNYIFRQLLRHFANAELKFKC